MGDYLDAMDRYARLALKVQANSRATLEALAKRHQPREQIAKHVHMNKVGRQSSQIISNSTGGAKKMENQSNNSMQPEPLARTPCCLARTRKGTECQSPAVKGRGRCRMHGGTNPGAPRGTATPGSSEHDRRWQSLRLDTYRQLRGFWPMATDARATVEVYCPRSTQSGHSPVN